MSEPGSVDLRKWPKYKSPLASPLTPGADFVEEIASRIRAICQMYGIDPDDELAERRLLVVMLHRHVPGFGYVRKPGPKEKIDPLFFAETVDLFRAQLANDGKGHVSDDAAVLALKEVSDPESPIGKASVGRLLRIYTGRKQEERMLNQRMKRTSAGLRSAAMANMKLYAQQPTSITRLLMDLIKRRRAKS